MMAKKRFRLIRAIIFTFSAMILVGFAFLWFGKMDVMIKGIAVVVPKEEAQIQARANGEILEIRVHVGDRVKAGDVLMKQDDFFLKKQMEQMKIGFQENQNALNFLKSRVQFDEIQSQIQILNAKQLLRNAKIEFELLKEKPLPEVLAAAQQGVLQSNLILQQSERALLDAEKSGNPQQIEAAQREFKTAQSMYQMSLQRLKELQKGATAEEIESAKAVIESAKLSLKIAETSASQNKALKANQIQTAEARMKLAELDYNQAIEAMENATIRAPIAGVVTSLHVKAGDFVKEGSLLCTVVTTHLVLMVSG